MTTTGIVLTKSEKIAAWERGGGATNTGDAFVYTAPDGSPCRPFFVNTRGHLSCGEHALIPLEVGSWVVAASHHRGRFHIEVCRFERFDLEKGLGEAATVESCRDETWQVHRPDIVVPDGVRDAIRSARDKAQCYHCRHVHYALPR